jgi:uncharacterized lipoprotein YddW (UPF0748 family)
MDVVERYDVDGIHFDDYFYPYRSYNDGADFPDDESWERYQKSGGQMSRNDWRRNAVDTFVARLYQEIKAVKPHVELGISPFGIWRPGHPESIEGLDQYDVLYADPKKWFNDGVVDYLTPQLYWPIGKVQQSFPVLLGWWETQNTHARHLWPGTSIGRARGENGATEIVNQIMITRGMLPEGPGICMFSMKVLMREESPLATALLEGPYRHRALIPASTWLDQEPPEPPQIGFGRVKGKPAVEIERMSDDTFLLVVYEKRGKRWSHTILPRDTRWHALEDGTTAVAVTAVDRCRNESAREARPVP